jgi:arylsulfatase A-like enzyme
MKQDRPNILVIQADQLAARYLGAHGNSVELTSSTPTFAHYLHHLDYRFAEE